MWNRHNNAVSTPANKLLPCTRSEPSPRSYARHRGVRRVEALPALPLGPVRKGGCARFSGRWADAKNSSAVIRRVVPVLIDTPWHRILGDPIRDGILTGLHPDGQEGFGFRSGTAGTDHGGDGSRVLRGETPENRVVRANGRRGPVRLRPLAEHGIHLLDEKATPVPCIYFRTAASRRARQDRGLDLRRICVVGPEKWGAWMLSHGRDGC